MKTNVCTLNEWVGVTQVGIRVQRRLTVVVSPENILSCIYINKVTLSKSKLQKTDTFHNRNYA